MLSAVKKAKPSSVSSTLTHAASISATQATTIAHQARRRCSSWAATAYSAGRPSTDSNAPYSAGTSR